MRYQPGQRVASVLLYKFVGTLSACSTRQPITSHPASFDSYTESKTDETEYCSSSIVMVYALIHKNNLNTGDIAPILYGRTETPMHCNG